MGEGIAVGEKVGEGDKDTMVVGESALTLESAYIIEQRAIPRTKGANKATK